MTPPPRKGPLLTALLCALLFAALATWVSVRHGAPLPGDAAVRRRAIGYRPPVALALSRGITFTGTGVCVYLLALLAGAAAGRGVRGRVLTAVGALGVLVLGQLIRTGLMELLARPRPDRADWAARASGFSFPSGHTTTSALVAGLVCWAATRSAGPALARTVCALALCWAVAVGLTRVHLGMHWPSDVVGGWLLAGAWLGALYAVLPAAVLGERRGAAEGEPGEGACG